MDFFPLKCYFTIKPINDAVICEEVPSLKN